MTTFTRTTSYCGYTIQPKLDFGGRPHIINGVAVMSGFVVTKQGQGNVMPGAAWFVTEDEAMDGIAALIVAEGNSDKFWALMRLARRTSNKEG